MERSNERRHGRRSYPPFNGHAHASRPPNAVWLSTTSTTGRSESDEVLTISTDQLNDVPTAGSALETIAKIQDRLVMTLDAATLVNYAAADALATS